MKKELKEIFNKADELVDTFQVHTNKAHLNIILTKYNLLELYEASKKDHLVHDVTYHDDAFTVNYVLNIFEGCRYSSVSANETRLAILFALYYPHVVASIKSNLDAELGFPYSFFKSIITDAVKNHNKVKGAEPFTLDDNDYFVLKKLYSVCSIKYTDTLRRLASDDSSNVYKVTYDAYYMFMYDKIDTAIDKYLVMYYDYLDTLICNNELRKEDKASFDIFVEKLSRLSLCLKWQSKWGKKKAFMLNWPVTVNKVCSGLKNKKYPMVGKTLAEIY